MGTSAVAGIASEDIGAVTLNAFRCPPETIGAAVAQPHTGPSS